MLVFALQLRCAASAISASLKKGPEGCSPQAALLQQWSGEQLRPAPQHLLNVLQLRPSAVDAHHNVIVVAHHCIGGHINGKDVGQFFHAGGNPAPSVFKVLAAVVVMATQKSPAHTARDGVVLGGIGQADEGGSWGRV